MMINGHEIISNETTIMIISKSTLSLMIMIIYETIKVSLFMIKDENYHHHE